MDISGSTCKGHEQMVTMVAEMTPVDVVASMNEEAAFYADQGQILCYRDGTVVERRESKGQARRAR